ncbi:MAG: tetratricopeptide repeat protein [Candidatus Eisenbacteria bacterium]
MRRKIALTLVCAAVAFAAAFIQFVNRGYVGAIDAGDSVRLMGYGPHLRAPWQRVAFYPIETREITIRNSSEGPQGRFNFDISLELSVRRNNVAALHRSYRGKYAEVLISPLVADFLRRRGDGSGNWDWGGDTQKTGKEIVTYLNSSLATYKINVYAASLRSFEVVTNPEDKRISAVADQVGGRVIVVGCDGFDWEIYRAVSKIKRMPNIEKLIAEGATGDLLSMEPLISPMIWTTLATGVEPPAHGIVDFLMKDAATGEDVPISSGMRRVPALWNMMTRFGRSSGFIGWLGTFPAEAVKGFMVSDRVGYHIFDPRWQKGASYEADRGGARRADTPGLIYPDNLVGEIRPFILDASEVPYETVADFIKVGRDQIAPQAKTFDPLDLPRNLRVALASNLTYESVARYAYKQYRPQLFSVYLDLIDNTCHLFIKYMEPHTQDVSDRDAQKYGGAVLEAYAHTDRLVGEWLKVVDEGTTLIFLSDHGFKSGDLRPRAPSVVGAPQAVAWHRMAGAIALYGNHVRKGAKLTDAGILDIAPTILRLVGLPKAKDMSGRVLEAAFDSDWLAVSSQTGEIATYGVRTAVASSPRQKEEEAAILDRLKALGYVGGAPTDLTKLAHSLMMKGEFDKAIEIWNEILAKEPGNLDVVVAMGNALIQKGDLDKAYMVLSDATKKDPNFLPARNMLALYHINVGHLDEAARISKGVIANDPKNAEAYFNLGVVLDQQGRYDESFAAFKQSVELRGDFDQARMNLGNAYLRRGRSVEAKIQFEKAIEINPGDPHAWYSLGRIAQTTNRPNDAIANYREALKRMPSFNPARIGLAIALASGGQFEEAKRELESGLQYKFDLGAINTNIGILDRQIGDAASAEKHFKQAIAADPQYIPARLDLADLYAGRGDKAKARREVEAALRLDPTNAEAKRLLGTLR